VAQHAAQPEHDLDDALRGGSGILEMESQLWGRNCLKYG
jgi:hypothetical protein